MLWLLMVVTLLPGSHQSLQDRVEQQCFGNKACMATVAAADEVSPNRECIVCHKLAVPWIPTPLNNVTAATLLKDPADCALDRQMAFMLNVSAHFAATKQSPPFNGNVTAMFQMMPQCNMTHPGPRYEPKFANMSFTTVPPLNASTCMCSSGIRGGPRLGYTDCKVNITFYDSLGFNCSISDGTHTVRPNYTECHIMSGARTSGPVSWVCGQTAYTNLPQKKSRNGTWVHSFPWNGCCTPAMVVPHMAVLPKNSLTRKRRAVGSKYNGYVLADPWTTPGASVGWSLFLGGGTTATLNKINGLAWQMLVMANSSTEAFFLINAEMRAIRQAVLQNRMALDLLLSHEGGVCQVLNTSCCFSIPDYYENITDLVSHMKQAIHEPPPVNEPWLAWLESFLGPWGRWLLPMVLPIICLGLLILCIVPCVMNCISNMITRAFSHYQMFQMIPGDEDPVIGLSLMLTEEPQYENPSNV
ncbi:syncytin-A-like [Astyanax mexicanus]|uniref:syncytin-A-like n=1 Tax=Astyanax mexicanus TaxID=7994 RepID=UPI0020CB30A7|nr:syncytin-A-like [Astyanax mexicanus]XP_049329730.1 syncytin-A-like [Astyanax mexicanus]XP_049329731.1 syncytin-A-like [Astyanax mexicanus]